jgi:hypothetical protein
MVSSSDHMRDVPTSPHFCSASIARQHAGATGDAFFCQVHMKDFSIAIASLSDDFVSQGDEKLLAFIDTLRVSVRARVAAGQRRGLPLTEIVGQVREMVRLAEEDADRSTPFPPRAFPAILKQALAWCVEAYRPAVDTVENDPTERPHGLDPK